MRLTILTLFLGFQTCVDAQSTVDIIRKWESNVEYYTPLDENREIQTISINIIHGWERQVKSPFTFGAGITITSAWGSIIQLDDNFNEIEFENSASGIGPIFYLKYEPFNFNGLSLAPDFLGGLIFYSDDFPTGGDFYNFMWRLGGTLTYDITQSGYSIGLSFRWMHVSNGQGVTPKNPSYEGLGIGITLVKYLN